MSVEVVYLRLTTYQQTVNRSRAVNTDADCQLGRQLHHSKGDSSTEDRSTVLNRKVGATNGLTVQIWQVPQSGKGIQKLGSPLFHFPFDF